MNKKSQNSFSLAIHGGAGGTLKKARQSETAVRRALEDILEQGREVLARGGSALDAVTLCVKLLEDCPLFNAGRGAVPNKDGRYELDASIMDGKTLEAGAVAAVVNVRNPVELARLVLEKTPHVMLAGKSAADFARAHGIAMTNQTYFKNAHEQAKKMTDKSKKHGTVGAVARDIHGHVAAATSTGGSSNKMPGRIGDSPLIGAGNFADNASGAVSCTGIGEHFIRTVLAGYIGFLIEREGLKADKAAQIAINRLADKVNGDGGFILVDKDGRTALAQSCEVMRCGWIERGGAAQTTLQAPIQARPR